MKRYILIFLTAFLVHTSASAQSQTAKKATTTAHKKKEATNKKKSTTASSTPLDNRKEYKWSNGQSSTPTGKDATPVNGGYSSLQKDTSTKARRKN